MSVVSIIALDLSLAMTGWTVARRGHPPVFGAIAPIGNLGDGQHGRRYVSLNDRLMDVVSVNLPLGELWFEAALPPQEGRGQNSAIAQWSCATIAQMVASRNGLRADSEHKGTVMKHVLGRGSFGGSDANKNAALAWTHSVGLSISDHNIADSAVLAEWAANCAGFSIVE